jgi:diguanylate cyclase (GGDEF)-like protein
MTNLGNRRNLYDQLKHLIAYNSRHRVYGAVLLIDLDKLSEINEQLGQEPVKKIFMITAKRLLATLRKEDIVCHTGGSEFYVLLSRLTEDKSQSHEYARQAAKRILAVLQEPLLFKKKPLDIRPCIGVQLISPEVTSVRRILNDLDTAMYNAKRSEEAPIAFTEEELANFGLTHQK